MGFWDAQANRSGAAIAMAALFAVVLGGMPIAVSAQTVNPQAERNVPLGSPFGQAGQRGTGRNTGDVGEDQDADTAPVADAGRIEPVQIETGGDSNQRRPAGDSVQSGGEGGNAPLPPAPPNEFETYVEKSLGKKLPRFGADLIVPAQRDFAVPATTSVPPGYILGVGDEIAVGLTGSIEASADFTVDVDGRIFLPRVGPVQVAGKQFADLQRVIARAVGAQYRDFRVSVSVRKLRGIRVYVTGFANNPGAYSVNSLSTMVNAVFAAGGPSAGGSFRSIKLFRNGVLISNFDLYDLVRGGDRSADQTLQNGDVLYIPPLGQQVAISGSVNAEAVYEMRPGESIEDLLAVAGGPNALADASRVMLYRLSNLDTKGGIEVARAELATNPIEAGDIVQVLSVGTIIRPLERQGVLVRLEGEVNKPGNYYVAPGTRLGDVLAMAGGTTARAFIFGANLQRNSVRQQQQEGFAEAIRQLELGLTAAPLTGDQSIDPAVRVAQLAAARAVLDRLRTLEPDGRMILDLPVSANSLPEEIVLENNDRIYIPPRATAVGVFGSVYRPASFYVESGKTKTVSELIEMAGGTLRVADRGEIFVVRANGAVISRKRGALRLAVQPGDVVFVPVRTQASSIWARIRDISQIIFQLGLGAAAFVAVSR